MQKSAGSTIVLMLLLTLVAALALHACGSSSSDRRTRERCEVCDPAQIDPGCVDQCKQFCVPGEDCVARCNRECDRCKAELECHACTSGCTGTVSRCAPVDQPLVCEDGTF